MAANANRALGGNQGAVGTGKRVGRVLHPYYSPARRQPLAPLQRRAAVNSVTRRRPEINVLRRVPTVAAYRGGLAVRS